MQTHRKILIAANWKENLNVSQASLFMHRLEETIAVHRHVEVALFPSMLVLQPLSVQLDRRKFRLGAQDGYYKDSGAYTGEVSMAMIRDLVHYVIVGHSERRHIFNESDDLISKKVEAAVRNGIMPVLCVGETLEERMAGHTRQILHNQLVSGLLHVTAREASAMVIAYEPVWAIGTGQFAKPDQVESAISYIRKLVSDLYGERAGRMIRVLYGGSVDDHNAQSYLEIESCDGALVGGASLNQYKFAAIVDAAFRVQQKRMGG